MFSPSQLKSQHVPEGQSNSRYTPYPHADNSFADGVEAAANDDSAIPGLANKRKYIIDLLQSKNIENAFSVAKETIFNSIFDDIFPIYPIFIFYPQIIWSNLRTRSGYIIHEQRIYISFLD